MRLFDSCLLTVALVGLAFQVTNAYYLADDLNTDKDLSSLESSPEVSIIYPRALGPEVAPVDSEIKKTKTESDETETKEEEVTPTTTTVAPSTTEAEVTPTTTESESTESTSTTTTTPTPDSTTTAAPTTTTTTEAKLGVNRVWHFNDQGVNTNAVWFSPSRDSEAVESNQAPVYASRVQPTPSTVFVRKPVFAAEEAESNTFAKRVPSSSSEFTVGEYPSVRESERNLYFPDIARIQSGSASNTASNTASVASASSASTTYTSASSAYKAASEQGYGTKGGAQYRQSAFWQQNQVQSPVKAIRKVVVKSGKALSENTKTELNAQSQPVRVRVVVQPQQQSTKTNAFQNNYLERLQDSKSSSSFFAKKVTNEYQARSNAYSVKSAEQSDDYVQVGKVRVEGTKTAPAKQAPIKSLPPPPAAIKSPPKPAPIKSYPTKSAVKAAVRAPVFEQERENYEENPEPEPYSFNFNVADESGNGQFRREEGDKNGVVRGSYGYTDAWGLYRIVDYVADANGFRATIRTNEPGLVEKNPVTNEVDAPAHIKVAAEDTPSKVLDLMRLTKPKYQF